MKIVIDVPDVEIACPGNHEAFSGEIEIKTAAGSTSYHFTSTGTCRQFGSTELHLRAHQDEPAHI